MNSLIRIFLAAMLWLTGAASADVAKVAALGKGENLVVDVHVDGGYIPQVTQYTFSLGKVVIVENGKNIGEVALTANEQAQVDRFLDLVRNARRGAGSGVSTYIFKLIKNGKERRGMGEKHRIRTPQESKATVLSLWDLKQRAAK